MEEEKAAAYYDELTRKGEGAARFKQGLGFSQSSDTSNPSRASALPSQSSFLSNFVRASSPGKASDLEKQLQLENIQNKLKKKQSSEPLSRVSDAHDRDRNSRRSSSRERDREFRRRSRSRDGSGSRRRKHRSSSRDRDRERSDRRRRRSRSYSDEERRRRRSLRERERRGRRSRSSSPSDRRSEKSRGDGAKGTGNGRSDKERNGGGDYAQVIEGYAEMTPAERVKAKTKLQLSQTVEKDTKKGMGAGWERFEFNKDAPLDDEEIEAAEDDATLVKNMGQSFRFSAVEAKREEQIRAAHDEAMFGAPTIQLSILSDEKPTIVSNSEDNDNKKEAGENGIGTGLLSDKVLAKQQGSWRDRARKLQNGSKS